MRPLKTASRESKSSIVRSDGHLKFNKSQQIILVFDITMIPHILRRFPLDNGKAVQFNSRSVFIRPPSHMTFFTAMENTPTDPRTLNETQ